MISGGIILWSGAIVDIPSGFVICDGNNGSPDLRDKFVAGAGSAYAVGANGGSVNHAHTTQLLGPPSQLADDVITGSYKSIGTTNLVDNLPPYFAMAYIMKT